MLSSLRAGVIAVLVAAFSFSAQAADKPFQRDDLADAAIKLEAQIKSDAGPVAKPVATLRHDADAAFQRNDFRAGKIAARRIPFIRVCQPSWFRTSAGLWVGFQSRPSHLLSAHRSIPARLRIRPVG